MKKTGYTIIESLFVIAIFGVMMSLGLSFFSRDTDKFKVEKTALQIQHILQSGMAYYVDHGNLWPQAGNTGQQSDFVSQYIGKEVTKDPWGDEGFYQYKAENPDPKVTSRFQVSITLPSNQLAGRVAALLPVAFANNNTIYAYVSVPGWNIQATSPDVTIAKISQFQEFKITSESTKGKEIVVPESVHISCPTGRNIDIIPMIQGFSTDGITHTEHSYKTSINVTDLSCPKAQEGDCTFNLKGSMAPTDEDYITVSFGYIALCEKA